jgi:hypothetical protein
MTKPSFLMLLLLAFLLSCISCGHYSDKTNATSDKANTAAEMPSYKGNMNGVVEGNKKLTLSDGDNLEDSIRKTSLGPIFLSFLDSKNSESRVQVPDQAMTEINFYLRSNMSSCLIPFQNLSDANEKIARDQKLMKDANITINNLVLIEITTPEGKRKLSQIEAYDLIKFVGLTVSELCQSHGK